MRARGFTLLELLVALSIFAMMAAMAYGGLSSVIRARTGVDASLERTQRLQQAVFRLQSDLEQAAARGVRDQFGDPRPALAAEPALGLSFTRHGWRNPLQEPRSHLQRVRYRLDEEGRLVRHHWRVLDRAQDSAPVETVLLEDVQRLEWRFLDGGREWRDRWPPLAADAPAPDPWEAELPLVVEVRLTTEDRGEIRQLFAIPGTTP
jgi:general secretion pathway protein J